MIINETLFTNISTSVFQIENNRLILIYLKNVLKSFIFNFIEVFLKFLTVKLTMTNCF